MVWCIQCLVRCVVWFVVLHCNKNFPTSCLGGVLVLPLVLWLVVESLVDTWTLQWQWLLLLWAKFNGKRFFEVKSMTLLLTISNQVPHYLAGQYLGAFLASFCVFLAYWDALVWWELSGGWGDHCRYSAARYEHETGGYRVTPDTAGIFGTFPSTHLTYQGGMGDQILGTALLLLCVCAITDKRNMQVILSMTRSRLVANLWSGQQATRPLLCRPHCAWYRDLFWVQLWVRYQPC